MAGQPAVQVTGAKELRRALQHMARDLDDLKAIHREAAQDVADRAREKAPKRSGALAADIRVSATKTAGRVLVGRKKIPYAGVIHFGWPRHNIAAQPFIFDALDERAGAVADRYVKRVDELVIRVGAETP
jgi:hypothetical protein